MLPQHTAVVRTGGTRLPRQDSRQVDPTSTASSYSAAIMVVGGDDGQDQSGVE
jgi:hypothetical protein